MQLRSIFVRHIALSVVFFLTFSLFSISNLALAQSQSGAGLSPTLIEQGADPGELIQTSITVSNLSDQVQTYFMYARDISGVRDIGTPIYAAEGAEKTGFEMSGWITLEQTEVTLEPDQERRVDLVIQVPENATPGSHFSGIFVSAEPPELDTVGAGVGFEVANIVSIRISGEAVESAQIRTFSTDKLFYSDTEVEFSARVENKGNVLIRPYGPLEVFNMFGERVALITFNEGLGGVFPNTIRDFKLVWSEDSPGFGRYEARLSMVYGQEGTSQSTITGSTSFWILPISIVQPALIALGILLLITYITIKLYVRRKLRVATSGRRLVRQRAGAQRTSTFLVVAVVMLTVTALFLLVLLLLFA